MALNSVKKRHWAFVLYPESAPSDWLDKLQLTGLQCAISPLHDKDVNPTGEEKKPHYHVIATYSGPTTYNSVKTLTDSLNCPIPQALEQLRGYYRYLTHTDNPEKHQYNEADIVTVNGFNIADFCELTKTEVNTYKREIEWLIRSVGFIEYGDVADYLVDNELLHLHDILTSHTMHFSAYIRSKRHGGIKGNDGERR